MMDAVDVRINQHQLRKATEMLSGVKGGIDRALLGSVQRSRRQAKTWASKQVRDRIRVKKKDVDQHLTTTRPTKAAPVSRITLKKRSRIPLKRFSLRQKYTRKDRKTGKRYNLGVTYRISKSGGRKWIKNAFGADRGVWQTLGGHGYVRLGASRFPIAKLHGPSPWGVFLKAGLLTQWKNYAAGRMRKNLDDQIRFLLLKHNK
jgi:hypothetical protein